MRGLSLVSTGPVRMGGRGSDGLADSPKGPGYHQYFGLIEGTRRRRQDWEPGSEPDGLIRKHGSAHLMKHRMTRAWQLAMAVAPLAAIAVVEAAMKRWF